MSETIEDVLGDLDRVFRFEPDMTYQQRAHEYLVEHGVQRSCSNTAVQRVVRHIVERAVACAAVCDDDLKGRMIEEATRLLELARDMGA